MLPGMRHEAGHVHGVLVEPVPWARHRSRFARGFEGWAACCTAGAVVGLARMEQHTTSDLQTRAPRARAIKGSSSALVKSLEELASVQRAETESLKKAGSRLSRAYTPCSGRRSCQVGQQQNQGVGQDGLRLP